MDEFVISYDQQENTGLITNTNNSPSSAWQRLVSVAINIEPNTSINPNQVRLAWYQALTILREFAPLQKQLKFKFATDDSSRTLVLKFLEEQRVTRANREIAIVPLSDQDVEARLRQFGFTRRQLKSFQTRDLLRLISLQNGANFSVPGAGKTTVTLAVHLLTSNEKDKLLVICPKSAFSAWTEILEQCIDFTQGWPFSSNSFINLSGFSDSNIVQTVTSENRFFFTNYEQFVARRSVYAFLLSTVPIHLVLDESHRMKAGELSQRGAALLSVANLPKRRDILSGTPMPQSPSDLQSQLDFLWPGSSLGLRIQRGENPSLVISGLFTRTTKVELDLPRADRHFIQVPMSKAEAALYGVVRNEVLNQLSSFRAGHGIDVIKARKSVMRLLQLASNPVLAIRGLSEDVFFQDFPLINAILENPISTKIQEACKRVRENASQNRKTVLWTIFTQNIIDLEHLLADLNPVSIYGAIKTGEADDETTREGRLKRFHNDPACMLLIANPAAAGEGISLHEVCHEAIYLDRSYITTHYLQSIDRIHRLGLLPGTITNITILQSAPPVGLGSIDYSVSRRLARKIRAMQQLLDDPDLNLIALDEENAEQPIDYNLDFDDVADLIEELEGRIPYDPNDGI